MEQALSERSSCDQGRREERNTAQSRGCRLRPQSGAGVLKGDFPEGLWLMEHKSTEKESLRLQREWLEKIRLEAVSSGRLPAVFVVIGDERWVMVPEETFDTMEER